MAEIKRTYYESGELKSECFMINGKKYDEYKHYYKNGQLWKIVTYIDGKENNKIYH